MLLTHRTGQNEDFFQGLGSRGHFLPSVHLVHTAHVPGNNVSQSIPEFILKHYHLKCLLRVFLREFVMPMTAGNL